MKLAVIGGGGVRSPFLAKTVVTQAKDIGITQIVFQDRDPEKLRIFGGLSRQLANRIDDGIDFILTESLEAAVTDADFIITTIRVGGDPGRAKDERIALKYGLLGQETTGAGGFSMALRSVPVIGHICETARRLAKPGVLLFNFTNPSGIVTQAMRDAGYDFVYGICDAPSGFIRQLRRLLEVPAERLSMQCFGLNHLSWFREVKVDGRDITAALLDNPALYRDTEMKLFDRRSIRLMEDCLPNEYLYFYLYREKAVASILESGMTRGESVLSVNTAMMEALRPLDVDRDFSQAFGIYMEAFANRENSYMAIESGRDRAVPFKRITAEEMIAMPDEGGYAGVAMDFIRALAGRGETEMVLSVPNDGVIQGLAATDIVEVMCHITAGAVKPIPVGPVPEQLLNLIRSVKHYERMTVQAIQTRRREDAVRALMFHPLVSSLTLASALTEDYLAAFAAEVGEWE